MITPRAIRDLAAISHPEVRKRAAAAVRYCETVPADEASSFAYGVGYCEGAMTINDVHFYFKVNFRLGKSGAKNTVLSVEVRQTNSPDA
jgi:hypothetical protein